MTKKEFKAAMLRGLGRCVKAVQQEPEKYQDLQIRVCGWNVFWNSLKKEEQDFFIRQAMAN